MADLTPGMGNPASAPDSAPSQQKFTIDDWQALIDDPRYKADPDWKKVQTAHRFFNAAVASDPRFQQDTPERQDEIFQNFQKTIPVDRGLLTQTWRGLAAGFQNLTSNLASAGAAVSGALGMPEVEEAFTYEKYLQQAEAEKQTRPPEQRGIAEKPSQLLSPTYIARQVAETVPSLAAAGAGAALGGLSAASPILATVGAGAVGGVLEGANQYNELVQRGATREDALGGMLAMTVGSGALNAFPFGKLFGVGGKLTGNALVRAVKQGLLESLTEYAEEPLSATITQVATKEGLAPGELAQRLKQGLDVVLPSFLLGSGLGAMDGQGNIHDKQTTGAEPGVTEGTGTPPAPGEAPSLSTEATQWASLSPQQQEFVLTYTPASVPVEVDEAQNISTASQEAPGSTFESQPTTDIPLKGIDAQEALKSSLGQPVNVRITDKKGKVKYAGLFTPLTVHEDTGRIEGTRETGDKVGKFTYSLASIEILPSTPISQNMRPATPSSGSTVIDNPLQQNPYPKVGMVEQPRFSEAEGQKVSTIPTQTFTLGSPEGGQQTVHELPDGTRIETSAGYQRMFDAVKKVFPDLDIAPVARIERLYEGKYQGDALGSVLGNIARITAEDIEPGEVEGEYIARLGDKAGSTVGHEGLHVMVTMLGPNDDIVQKGLAQFGSEEALVQKAADHYARLVNGEPAPDLTFAQWLKSIWERFVRSIRSLSVKDRAELLAARMYEGGFDQYNLPGWHTVFGEHLFGPEFGPQYGGGKEQTDTPAFKRWFGNSKVVDENGKPLVVYHGTGTKKDFTQFRPKHTRGMQFGFGMHFTPDESFAARYAEGEDGRVYPVYLSAKNVLDTDQVVTKSSELGQLADRILGSKNQRRWMPDRGDQVIYLANAIESVSSQRAEKILQEAGYDAVKYTARMLTADRPGAFVKGPEAITYVVFNSEQIKSATGNIGTFDPSNPDIRFAQRTKDDLLKELAEVEQWLASPPTTGGQPASPAMIKRFEAKRDNLYQQLTTTPSFSMKEATSSAPGFTEAETVGEQMRVLGDYMKGAGKWAADAFSVEAPFLRTKEKLGEYIGETARRYQSVRTAFNDYTLHTIVREGIIKTLAPLYQKSEGGIRAAVAGALKSPILNIDKAAWAEALDNFALIHESKQAREDFLRSNPDKAVAYTRAFKIVDDYIAQSLDLLKQHGVTDDFKARAEQMARGEITSMQEEIASWQAKLARTHSANIRSQLEPKIAENKKLISELEDRLENLADLNYLPMPTSLVLNSSRLMGTKRGRMAAIRFLTSKERGDVKMADLLKKVDPDTGQPYFKKSDFSIIKVLSSYSYKVGRDLGTSRVLNAALGRRWKVDDSTGAGHFESMNIPHDQQWAYKLKTPDEPVRSGFVRLRTSHGGYIEDYALREPLAAWFESQAFRNMDETLAPIWRFWAAIKMAQFYNPFILPAYNVYQAWMAGAARSFLKGKTWKRAWNSAVNRDEHWAAMQHYGGFSHPFSDTQRSLLDDMNRMARTNPKLHGLMNLGLPVQAVKYAYAMSQDAAWHMDRFTRMFTYFHLLDMGLDSEMAAKRSAEFMGDYANVPQQTRVFLNKLFFTPTFKIATARLQANMVKSAITQARNFVQGKNTPYETAVMSHALLWSVGALMLTNFFMRQLGFKDERWGWKYVKNVETEDGPKQLVVTMSNPINLLPKYAYRWQDAANPAETNPIQRWLDSTSWELHPIWRTISSLIQNRNERGEAIVNPFDSGVKIQADRFGYFFGRTIPMFKWFQDTWLPNTTKDSKEAVRVLDQNVSTAFAYMLRAAAFPYLRTTAERRAFSQVRNLMIEYRTQMRRDLLNATTPEERVKAVERERERMKRLQERVNQVWQTALEKE